MLVDNHTHNYLCKHATGTLEEYVLQAIAIGLDEIGLSDHTPMPDNWDAEVRMTEEQFRTEYAPAVLALKEKYKHAISVKFGLEGDFMPGTEEWVKSFNAKSDFDYVIGSVHYIDDWGFDNPTFIARYEVNDVNEIYAQYYERIKGSAKSGLFDIIGHCDLVKKFGHRPTKAMEEILRETFAIVKASGMAVEINTSGLRKPVKEMYPSESVLTILSEFGIPLTLGSDAHAPGDVGRDFDLAKQLIDRYGGGKISVFSKRQRSEVRI
jgi:histidinol-phosphatase (PHP family)